jgi:hypothetical protein
MSSPKGCPGPLMPEANRPRGGQEGAPEADQIAPPSSMGSSSGVRLRGTGLGCGAGQSPRWIGVISSMHIDRSMEKPVGGSLVEVDKALTLETKPDGLLRLEGVLHNWRAGGPDP